MVEGIYIAFAVWWGSNGWTKEADVFVRRGYGRLAV